MNGKLVPVVILLMATFLTWAIDGYIAEAQPVYPCMSADEREHIRGISLQAIDNALSDHVMHLFDVWMADPTLQPKRAQTGMSFAIDAHIRATRDAQAWNPPTCETPRR
jgi:hypothetical protein